MISSSASRFFSCVVVIFAGAANLTGCARGLPDPGLTVDRSIKTASISAPAPLNDPVNLGLDADTLRDGETIANAVSSVQFTGKSVPWQNTATGSSGEIIAINERQQENGAICRDFAALRTSYDGIRNYSGTTCMNDTGHWQLTKFNPL